MKKKPSAIFIFVIILLCSLSFIGCDNNGPIIHTIHNVGTFSGYRVDAVRFEYKDAEVSAVVVKYCIDDVYIQTFPDPSYSYLVYVEEDDYLHLSDAYKQKLITHDDLLAIAEAEKPYDSLYDEETIGPIVHKVL